MSNDNETRLLECVNFIHDNIEVFDQDEVDHFERLEGYYLNNNHQDYLDEIIHYVEHLKKFYDL